MSSEAVLHSSNGPISGEYNVTGTLVVATSNAPVEIDVNLTSEEDTEGTATISTTNR